MRSLGRTFEGWNEAAAKLGRCATGGALLLGGLLIAAPADAKPPEGTPTPVTDPAHPQGSGASALVGAVSFAVGPSWGRGKARYDTWDWDGNDGGPPAPSFDSHSAVAPGGSLTFTLGGRVGSRWLVGGAFTIAGVIIPNRFTGETDLKCLFALGPELTLLPNPRGGVFAFARGGIGWLDALAWSAAVGGGYALPLGKANLVGLGLELSGVYSRSTEDGDGGAYIYKDESLASAAVLRLMF